MATSQITVVVRESQPVVVRVLAAALPPIGDGVTGDALLLEAGGGYLLLDSGDRLLLE